MPKQQEEKKKPELSPLQLKYVNVFSSMDGQIVLQDLLRELQWHSVLHDEQDLIKHNFAKYILDMCGGWQTKIHGIHK